MTSLVGILFLIVGLLIAVALHELGHLIPAKKFGVKVPQYFIGFGPTIWSTVKNGTEYGIKAIPLGGYVSLAGMLPPAKAGVKTHKADGSLTVAEEARRASNDELEPGEEDRAFWRLSVPKKLTVMLGGPVTNLVLAGICVAIVMSGFGVPTVTTTLGTVASCVTADPAECTDSDPLAPGAAAGLQVGDEIVSWGGVSVDSWEQIQGAIADGATSPTDVVIIRDGREMVVTVTPIETDRPVVSGGQVVTDDAGNQVTERKPYVGISPAYAHDRRTISEVPGATLDLALGTAKIVVELPVHLWNTLSDLVTGNQRDATGVVGIVGVADMAGSITSSENAQYTIADRTSDLFSLLASLNMSLFVFNMIPLLPLDGGHIFGALVEGVRRGWAKLRGKGDPGPTDTARLWPLSQVVIVFFVAMTVLLIVADLLNPVF